MRARHGNLQKHLNENPVQRMLINRFHQRVGGMIQKIRPKLVLDAGCGEGFSASALKKTVPEAVFTCLDIDRRALERGRVMFPNLLFEEGNVLTLSFPDASFDLVLCLEVLEHLPDPISALHELQRVSRKGIIISTPHEPWFRIGNLMRMKNVLELGNDPEHVNHWNRRTLHHLLNTCGLTVLESVSSFPWIICRCEK